jgi:molybdopterin molybdotransferase
MTRNLTPISALQAQRRVLDEILPSAVEWQKLEQNTGAILAENIYAESDIPPFDRVAMDGIAIRYQDFVNGGRVFSRQGVQFAGKKSTILKEESSAIEVMTGSVLPEGADTVVRYEDFEITGDSILLQEGLQIVLGQNVHKKGSDKPAGALLVEAGSKITPPIVGILASQGRTKVKCRVLPKVQILATGDELVPVGKVPKPHQIRMSNPYLVKSALTSLGIVAKVGHMEDNPNRMRRQLKKYLRTADIIIVSGAVSMGKLDYLPEVAKDLGFEEIFHGVKQRPGKPFWFGKKEGKVLFGFPGNPVSTAACTAYYLLPFVKAIFGMVESSHYKVCTLAADVAFAPPMTRLLPVTLYDGMDGMCYAVPVEGKGSGDYTGLAAVHGFAELEAEMAIFPKGILVRVFPLG